MLRRPLIPAAGLGKTRLAATVVGVLELLFLLTQTGNPTKSFGYLMAGRLVAVALIALLVDTYRRGRVPGWDPLVLPVMVFFVGTSLHDPIATVAAALSVNLVCALYGSNHAWIIRALASTAAVPAAVAISPRSGIGQLSWHSPTVLGALPQTLLLCLLTRGIYLVLVRQDRTAGREAVLARTGHRLLGAADVEAVHAMGFQAAEELVALTPGMVMLALRPHRAGLEVMGVAGLPQRLVGGLLPESVLADPASVLSSFSPKARHWQIDPAPPERFRALGSRHPLPEEVLDAFRALGNQVKLAEASRISHAELHHLANHDHLTELPNRTLFFAELAVAVDVDPPGTVALLTLDLDDFKHVNDAYGHAAGDELLVEVAARLAEAGGPAALPARFGGDEFALLLRGVADPADADAVGALLCAAICRPFRLAAATVTVGASVGIALSAPGLTAGDLTRCADIAMYSAKADGKNRAERFDTAKHGDVARHRTLELHLGEAFDRGEVGLRYQPYVELAGGACAGFEAFAVWRHPSFGPLPQRELMTLAERTGAVGAVGLRLLRLLCTDLAAQPGLPPGPAFGIDIAARQLLDPGFADAVGDLLRETGVDAGRLTFEIVESEQIDAPEARRQLQRIAALGIRIALDDFGTGYVSFASLRSFPLHQIKTDRVLLAADPAALEMVVSMGGLLGTQTVVQGVADEAEAARLRGTAATFAQGELFGPPLPVGELNAWLAGRAAVPG